MLDLVESLFKMCMATANIVLADHPSLSLDIPLELIEKIIDLADINTLKSWSLTNRFLHQLAVDKLNSKCFHNLDCGGIDVDDLDEHISKKLDVHSIKRLNVRASGNNDAESLLEAIQHIRDLMPELMDLEINFLCTCDLDGFSSMGQPFSNIRKLTLIANSYKYLAGVLCGLSDFFPNLEKLKTRDLHFRIPNGQVSPPPRLAEVDCEATDLLCFLWVFDFTSIHPESQSFTIRIVDEYRHGSWGLTVEGLQKAVDEFCHNFPTSFKKFNIECDTFDITQIDSIRVVRDTDLTVTVNGRQL